MEKTFCLLYGSENSEQRIKLKSEIFHSFLMERYNKSRYNELRNFILFNFLFDISKITRFFIKNTYIRTLYIFMLSTAYYLS